MYLEYRLNDESLAAFNTLLGLGKGKVKHHTITIAKDLSGKATELSDEKVKKIVETTICIRLATGAISTILTALDVAKEKSVTGTEVYYEDRSFTIEKDCKNYIDLERTISAVIESITKNSQLANKIHNHNLENTDDKIHLTPMVFLPPIAYQMMCLVTHHNYAMLEHVIPIFDIRLSNKIVILLSAKSRSQTIIPICALEQLAFGNLYIEEEEGDLVKREFTPYYKFEVNNYIFGVINLNVKDE